MKRLRKLLARQRALIEGATTAGREMTDAERAEFNSIQDQIRAIEEQLERDESDPAPATQQTEGNDDPPQEPTREQRSAIERAERERIGEIRSMCTDLGITEERANEMINNCTSVEAARELVINELRSAHAPIPRAGGSVPAAGGVQIIESESDRFARAAADGLLIKSQIITEDNAAEGARSFAGLTLKELATEVLKKEGQNVERKSADDVFAMVMRSAFNPSALFPTIMDQAIQKAYVEGHKTANVTFDIFTKKGTLNDFKKHDNNYLSGPAGEFLEVPENGELKADMISDKKRPQRQLKTYGRQFTMTRQAFINDDIGFVSRIPAKYAKSARKTINKQVYKVLIDNPKIYDGKNLFHASHGNLVTVGSGITAESLKAMILAMNTQLDEFEEAAIIRPAYIVVPSGYAFDMYTIFFSPTINTSGNTQAVNPLFQYRNKIQIVEDPTVNALCGGFGNVMPWWLIGDKDDTDFIEVDYLNGQEVPTLRRSEPAGTLGLVWDVFLDWGISVMDYRGAIKNPGIAINSTL
jgi:hypothetical protein